jgi:hypothetical protein
MIGKLGPCGNQIHGQIPSVTVATKPFSPNPVLFDGVSSPVFGGSVLLRILLFLSSDLARPPGGLGI